MSIFTKMGILHGSTNMVLYRTVLSDPAWEEKGGGKIKGVTNE